MGRRELPGDRLAAQEEPAGGAVVTMADGVVETLRVGQTPGQREPVGGFRVGELAGVRQQEAPVLAVAGRRTGLAPGQAHVRTAFGQVRDQLLGQRMAQCLGGDLDHDVVGNLPFEQVGRRDQPAERQKHRVAVGPMFGDAGERLDRRCDRRRVHDQAVGGDRLVLVQNRFAREAHGTGLAHFDLTVRGPRRR